MQIITPSAPNLPPLTSSTSDKARLPETEAETEVQETEVEETVEAAPEPEKEKESKKGGVQERFSELTAARKKAESERDELARKASETDERYRTLLEKFEAFEKERTQEKRALEAAKDVKPSMKDFQDPVEYEEALAAWGRREGMRIKEQELSEKAEADRTAAEAQKAEEKRLEDLRNLQESWNDRRAKALDRYPDFEEVAENPKVPNTEAMAFSIMDLDNGPDVAYYLGQHMDEAKDISGMSPMRQAIAIGKIAEKLAGKKPSRTKAPPPINPIKATDAGSAEKSIAEMSMEEHAANWKSRQQRNR